MKQWVEICDIRESRRHPGFIYAKLRDVKTRETIISATLSYIFDALRDRPELVCKNVIVAPGGDYRLI